MELSEQIKSLSFEQALRKLEEITDMLSDESIELDRILSLYEEGTIYLNYCRQKLTEAEAKIAVIGKDINPVNKED